MSEFKPGDVVRLKTGGPKMTVERVSHAPTYGDRVDCVWFDDNAQGPFYERFAPEVLYDVNGGDHAGQP